MSDNEVLVVASKIKTYIKNSGEMKTSAGVLDVLSDRLRAMCDQAIESASRRNARVSRAPRASAPRICPTSTAW